MTSSPPATYIEAAARMARLSPCQKSKRGAAIFDPNWDFQPPLGCGYNARPMISGPCDGSPTCRRDCGKLCVHAEQRAIRDALISSRQQGIPSPLLGGYELVHVKVVDGVVVAGGGPSCWQCARDIADVGLDAVWLYQDMWVPTAPQTPPKWIRYATPDFLTATLQHENLHPFVRHEMRVGAVFECSCGYQPSSDDDLAKHVATEMVRAGMGLP